MPSIAELFVSLGVKGGDKTVGQVTNIKKGMKETASVSLEAKAAIVGVMYTLEKLFATSGRAGTALSNFATTTGISAQTLQSYQWAAQQVGVSTENVTNAFEGLQAAMTDILIDGKIPEGLQLLNEKMKKGYTMDDVKEWQKAPEKFIQILGEYTRAETDFGQKRKVLGGLGVLPLQPAFELNAFTPKKLEEGRKHGYGDKELESLKEADRLWRNLGTDIEHAIGHFNAKHGKEIIAGISSVLPEVIKLANEFMKLAEKAELFKKLGMVFDGWRLIFEGMVAALNALNKMGGDKKDAQGIPEHLQGASPAVKQAYLDDEKNRKAANEAMGNFFANLWGSLINNTSGENSGPVTSKKQAALDKSRHDAAWSVLKSGDMVHHNIQKAIPPAAATGLPAGNNQGSVEVNQTLNFNADDGIDPQKVQDTHRRASEMAYRISPAQSRVS